MTDQTRADAPGDARAPGVRRMNWGCGTNIEKGWINVDRRDNLRGLDINSDLLEGLPLEDDSIDYIASMMALQEVPYDSLVPALTELRRVLRPGGVLRLGLPDLERLIAAYQNGDRDFFLIPDEDMKSLGGKFVLMTIWYGYTRTLFVWEFAEEILLRAGFSVVRRSAYLETGSPYPEIVALDNREPETLFVEAVK